VDKSSRGEVGASLLKLKSSFFRGAYMRERLSIDLPG
jgi:hypothetical protein